MFKVLRAHGLLKMKIAFFIDDLIHGGTQTWLKILIRGLAEKGCELKIFCIRNIYAADNLEELRKYADLRIIGERNLFMMHGLMELVSVMKKWKADIVQSQLPTSNWLGPLSAKFANVPVSVISIRSGKFDRPFWQYVLNKNTSFLADKAIFNSKNVMESAVSRRFVRNDQAIFIPNGVQLKTGKVPPADGNFFSGIKNDHKIVFGIAARLHESKGHKYLIDAFSSVISRYPEAELWICGGGNLDKALIRQVGRLRLSDKVKFFGDRNDVSDFIDAIDVFVHPSLTEGMPNSVMEAMAAGKPVIAGDADGIKELINDGKEGWLVKSGNSVELADKMIYMIENQAVARKIANTGMERIKNEFSTGRMIDSYYALYTGLDRKRRDFSIC